MHLTSLPDIDGIEKNDDMVRYFYEYILERQRMWYKRFVLKEPCPWTSDPVLHEWKFTNVSRYLDRGTVYFLDYLANTKDITAIDILWNSMFYRMINNMSCHKECGGFTKWSDWDYDEWYTKIRARHKTGTTVLCQSHNTCSLNGAEGRDKIERVCLVLKRMHEGIPETIELVKRSTTPEQVFTGIRSVYGYGEFLAYEVWCDLSYTPVIPWDENSWSNAGPGATRGLNRLFTSSCLPNGIKNAGHLRELIYWLTNNQRHYFELITGDPDAFTKMSHGARPVSHRGSEHTLCEISKKLKIETKTGTSFSGRYRSQEAKHLVDLDYSILDRFPKIR